MENTVEMTGETLRALFDEEIVEFSKRKNDVRKLIEEKYQIATSQSYFQTVAEINIDRALNIFRSDPASAMPRFLEFARDLFMNKDSVSKFANSEDKEAFEHFRDEFPLTFASVAECAFRIIGCEIEFRERSGLNAVIEAVSEVCAYADDNKCWNSWDRSNVCEFVKRVSESYVSGQVIVRRFPLFPLSQSLLAA